MKNMKKSVILALGALFLGNIAFSQSDEFQLTWGLVESDAKKSDTEITNPKKAMNVKTWMERGRRYLQVYTFDNVENVYYGTTKDQIPLIMKTGAKSETTSGDTTIMSFDRMDFYLVGGKVVRYARSGRAKEFFFPTHTAALDVATEAYMKAKEMDKDGKNAKKISDQLKAISNSYQKEALFFYYSKDYVNSAVYYTKAGNIANSGYTDDADSVRMSLLNNCGIINRSAKNYTQALSFFQDIVAIAGDKQTIDMYEGIYGCQMDAKDTTAAINTCLAVIEKFPNESKTVVYLNTLIDLYQKTGQSQLAMEYLQKAIEKDPNNTLYLVTMANMYETQNNLDKAIETYEKALAVNPKDENANLNLGVLYENKGNDLLRAADALWGKKGYQAKVDEGKSFMKKAYPYIETYAEVTSDNFRKKNAYKDLQSIYMKLNMTDKYKEAKAKYDAL